MKSAYIAALVALAAILGLATPAAAASADDCEGRESHAKLIVQVTGVRAAKGEIAITVYPDDPKRFLAPHSKLARVRPVAQAPTTTACFWLPAPGFYAVAVYHDQNANHDFDRTLVGLPAEGFAFSNDPPTSTALPPFKAVRFKADEGETRIKVKLRYLK
ncbi:MAG: conserved hypothetical secreted protein [Phenylobacterium sp.]|nr:conserved hypothetical secreted protein [Phenylobacterium sp.]